MKDVIAIIGVFMTVIGFLSVPISVCYGIYEWIICDLEFKFALFEALKIWVSLFIMYVLGMFLVFLAAE